MVETNSIGMKLALIPPGEFDMGSPKELIEEETRLHGNDGWYTGHLPGEGRAPGADHQAVLAGRNPGDTGRVPAGDGDEPEQVPGGPAAR